MGMHGWKVIGDFMKILENEGKLTSLYRGHSDAKWPLVPSIFRKESRGIQTEVDLYDWKSRASRFASPMPIDNIEWLVLAQHYGLATRFLDWTTSPLVALYFACDGDKQNDADGCVISIARSEFKDANNTLTIDPFSDERARPFLINAIGRNVRSTAQESYLSLHTPTDFKELKSKVIFRVPGGDKHDTILTLEKLGFTSERLHFDITKLVQRFKNRQR